MYWRAVFSVTHGIAAWKMVSEWIVCMHTWYTLHIRQSTAAASDIHKQGTTSTANPQGYSARGKINQYHAQKLL